MSKLSTTSLHSMLCIFLIIRSGHTLNLPFGNYLTNELLEFGPNAYIVRFMAIGPKSYSFVVYNPDDGKFTEISKCKGIS